MEPTPSFVLGGLDGRGVLFCSTCTSRLSGVAVAETASVRAAVVSDSVSFVLADCETDWLFSASAARAPAARISSTVGPLEADFFGRALGLVGVGVADSGGGVSDGCAAGLGASGFVSRRTTTSCACICPWSTRAPSSGNKNAFNTQRLDAPTSPIRKPLLIRFYPVYPVGRVTWMTGNGKRRRNSFSR
jgi:hypothetical protein